MINALLAWLFLRIKCVSTKTPTKLTAFKVNAASNPPLTPAETPTEPLLLKLKSAHPIFHLIRTISALLETSKLTASLANAKTHSAYKTPSPSAI